MRLLYTFQRWGFVFVFFYFIVCYIGFFLLIQKNLWNVLTLLCIMLGFETKLLPGLKTFIKIVKRNVTETISVFLHVTWSQKLLVHHWFSSQQTFNLFFYVYFFSHFLVIHTNHYTEKGLLNACELWLLRDYFHWEIDSASETMCTSSAPLIIVTTCIFSLQLSAEKKFNLQRNLVKYLGKLQFRGNRTLPYGKNCSFTYISII